MTTPEGLDYSSTQPTVASRTRIDQHSILKAATDVIARLWIAWVSPTDPKLTSLTMETCMRGRRLQMHCRSLRSGLLDSPRICNHFNFGMVAFENSSNGRKRPEQFHSKKPPTRYEKPSGSRDTTPEKGIIPANSKVGHGIYSRPWPRADLCD